MTAPIAFSDVEKCQLSEDSYCKSSKSRHGCEGQQSVCLSKSEDLTTQSQSAAHKLTPLQENVFIMLITLTQLIQTIPLGAGINSGLAIGEDLGANRIQSVWIVASYPLTRGAFVLVGGRLGAVWGHKYTLTLGCIIWTVWAFCGGYAPNLVAMCIMRALCGIGGGLMIPNTVAIIGITFPPGKKRNLGFALFGSMAPVGAAGGSLISAVIVQLSEWKWLFFFLGLCGSLVYAAALAAVPADEPIDPSGNVDWIGIALGISGLVLFNFTWNQAPLTGWNAPYNIILLVISILCLVSFSYWEIKVASRPILPFSIWKTPSFGMLLVVILFSFMSISIFFWYMNIYMITIREDSLIQVGIQYLPLTIGGCIMAFVAAWLVARVPAQIVICVGCLAALICNTLLATIPMNLTYWAMSFPALLISAFTIDLIVTSAQIITNSSVPKKYQGVGGSLVGTLLSYGMSTGLGFAGTVEVNTFGSGHSKDELLHGYHMAGYLGAALAGAAFVAGALFVRIPKETREGWDEESEGTATGIESKGA